MGTKPLVEGRGRQTSLSLPFVLSNCPSVLLSFSVDGTSFLDNSTAGRAMRLIRCALQHSDWLLVAKETCMAVCVLGRRGGAWL